MRGPVRYIASTDIQAQPHVTAQWTDDHLDEIAISNLKDSELTFEEYVSAWKVAHDLKSVREVC